MTKKKKKNSKRASVQSKKENNKFAEFVKAVWSIIWNKSDTEKRFTNAALSLMISLFLNSIAFLLALVAVYGAADGIYGAICAITTSAAGVMNGLFQFLIAIMMALFALILRGVANEAERETDINHLLALFSGITGFVALVVALISLGRG